MCERKCKEEKEEKEKKEECNLAEKSDYCNTKTSVLHANLYTGIMIGKITMAIENYKYFQYYSHQYFWESRKGINCRFLFGDLNFCFRNHFQLGFGYLHLKKYLDYLESKTLAVNLISVTGSLIFL